MSETRIYIDTTTGTYGAAEGLRSVTVVEGDLEYLADRSDSEINEYGLLHGERLVPVSEVVAYLNGINGDLGSAFQDLYDPQPNDDV